MQGAGELAGLDALRKPGPLVLVPTMGALHEGHLSLVEQGAALGTVVVTIFVNPTQFGPGEDFAAYPRDLASDLALLEGTSAAAVFAPAVSDMYGPPGEVTVRAGRRAEGLCGASRPGHFDGVLTVVAKLFGMVRPDIAIFGRKDAQQCLVIEQMVHDLRLPVRLVDAPTVREPDGLAMSSRNRYLDTAQRGRATCLSRALARGRALLGEGVRERGVIEAAMTGELAASDSVDYAALRVLPELGAPARVPDGRVVLAIAAKVGPARLIDNVALEIGARGVVETNLLGGEFPAGD
ncbi:MAG: pantoate--beta-alanine ligase [bacterium]|nr:pantoate--beta-alanine ligase [bacterium]